MALRFIIVWRGIAHFARSCACRASAAVEPPGAKIINYTCCRNDIRNRFLCLAQKFIAGRCAGEQQTRGLGMNCGLCAIVSVHITFAAPKSEAHMMLQTPSSHTSAGNAGARGVRFTTANVVANA